MTIESQSQSNRTESNRDVDAFVARSRATKRGVVVIERDVRERAERAHGEGERRGKRERGAGTVERDARGWRVPDAI